ncbi:MAG: IPExxxVDY family protein [Flavobacteriaceae bacterium]|nr:IPExxxVDY family protein [Flavobacteriaceae bacterium]
MAKVKSYILDEIEEDDFSLIALHSSCEAYYLAFLLNSNCQCQFAQKKKKKEGAEADHIFESYEWIDPIKGIEIRLFSNRYLKFQKDFQKGSSLFDLPETKELYLMQDLKEVDYIIKIDSGIDDLVMIDSIESIDQVSYRYLIDQSQLKIDSRLNLY